MLVLFFGFWLLGLQEPSRPPAARDLSTAKSLYVSADYDGALKVLSTIGVGASDEADQYRALCLLALGRTAEGQAQLQSLITRNPNYRMSANDTSPRLVAIFDDTRRRLLPQIIKDRYASARSSYERKDYAAAVAAFTALLTLLDEGAPGTDPGLGAAASDLRVPMEGFRGLAEAALAENAAASAARTASPRTAPTPALSIAAPAAVDRTAAEARAAIERTIQMYARAYATLDGPAVARLFKDGNPQLLQKAFDGLKSQSVEARDIRIALDGGNATVTMTWAVEAVPKAGRLTKTQISTRLRLVKTQEDTWIIVERR